METKQINKKHSASKEAEFVAKEFATPELNTKHYPRPEYDKCNAGHQLVEVYNEKYNRYDWDCPICIKKMQNARRDN